MEKIATHPAIVTNVANGKVSVLMHVVSACASCEAHSKCGFVEAKEKVVEIETRQWKDYQPGDNVTVVIQTANGLKAVLIAYVLPALVLIAAFAVFYSMHLSEGITALLTLAIVALYGLVLYFMRHRLQRKFTFQIRKA